MVEPGATHALDVGVLVAPGEGLLTDDGVDLAQLWHIRIVHVLAVLTKNIFVNIIFKKNFEMRQNIVNFIFCSLMENAAN